jgi:transposase-like protein
MRGVAFPRGERELLMKLHEQGVSLAALSRQTGVRGEVLSRWWMRYQQQGRAGLEPRSRRPHHASRRLAPEIEQQILQLRSRGWGPARIALALDIGHSSVHRVLFRHGRNRLRQPVPRVFRRYEKSRPGELLHLDLKYLYRWPNSSREYAYAAVDDFSREAVTRMRSERSSRERSVPRDHAAYLTSGVRRWPNRPAHHREHWTELPEECERNGISR